MTPTMTIPAKEPSCELGGASPEKEPSPMMIMMPSTNGASALYSLASVRSVWYGRSRPGPVRRSAAGADAVGAAEAVGMVMCILRAGGGVGELRERRTGYASPGRRVNAARARRVD